MMKQKIDIVYLWVDGKDRDWREKKQQASNNLKNHDLLEPYANVEWRFRDNKELLFSLRSIERYFPEHGNIFIITDNQVPDFLLQNKSIQLVSHKELMLDNYITTFSSKCIEAHIPFYHSLSEVFLYFNDDVFLWPDFLIEDFFLTQPIYYFDPPTKWTLSSWEELLKKIYADYFITHMLSAHTPKTIVKRDFISMAEEFDIYFRKTKAEVFRMSENISFLADFFPRWMIYHKKAWIGKKKSRYYTTSNIECCDELLKDFKDVFSFCINDTSDNAPWDDINFLYLYQILQKLFPEKSKFEK